MSRPAEITERDGWLWDERGNRNEIAHYGSREAAEKALLSLIDCYECVNCSDCSDCSHCSDCSYCSRCSYCSDCSDCSYCSRCSYCSDCSYCSYCSRCSDCSYCSRCSYCSHCSDCSRCSGKKGDESEAVVVPRIENIHQAIYEAASQPQALDMGDWHTCGTTHCRAGWVVTLAGEEGKALESRFNTELAAMLIYRESGSPINPGRFYDSNEAAFADMKRLAEQVPA